MAAPTGGRWVTYRGRALFIPAKHAPGGGVTLEGKPTPVHLANLRIPPAWTDLEVNPDPNGALLVRGRDAKGRLQAVYSEAHVSKQAAAKFAKVRKLVEKEPEIKAQNDRALKDPAKREPAAVTSLILATGLRPGSDRDTQAAKQAYRATTLEGRHVVSGASGVRLKFTGKKGVALDLPIEDKAVAGMLIYSAPD